MLFKRFIFSLLIVPAICIGQDWTNFNSLQGLADNSVTAIFIDGNNVKWFGTHKGVSVFDGKNWKTYDTTAGLASNQVTAIALDSNHTMWFGTLKGASRFDGTQWISYDSSKGLASNTVRCIAVDPEGARWFGTDRGVSRFNGDVWTTYTTANGLAANDVFSIAADNEGNIWFAADSFGVSRFDGKAWTTYTTANGLSGNKINRIAVDKNGAKWFATALHGVCRLSGQQWNGYDVTVGLKAPDVVEIVTGRKNEVWIGVIDYTCIQLFSPLCKFNGAGGWNQYSPVNSVGQENCITALGIDSAGNVWFGTSRGVTMFVPPVNTNTSHTPALYAKKIDAVCRYNPAARAIVISFELKKNQWVEVELYSALGKIVKRMVDGSGGSGKYSLQFDAYQIPSGTYICRIRTEKKEAYTGKVVVIR